MKSIRDIYTCYYEKLYNQKDEGGNKNDIILDFTVYFTDFSRR